MMRLVEATMLLIAMSIFPPLELLAQPASGIRAALAGEWQTTLAYAGHVVVIEQKGVSLKGVWKETWRERGVVCSGIWFDGEISGNTVSGQRYPCGGRMEPLSMKIRDADTLDVLVFTAGGTHTTITLRRIK